MRNIGETGIGPADPKGPLTPLSNTMPGAMRFMLAKNQDDRGHSGLFALVTVLRHDGNSWELWRVALTETPPGHLGHHLGGLRFSLLTPGV